MAFKITLQPSGHSFEARTDESVLKAAEHAGFKLPYGCGSGACGACKGKVLEGQVDHGAAQDHALSADERAAGMALFCCATPQSDLVLEVREVKGTEGIEVKKLPCRVQKLEKLAPDVMLLQLKLPASQPLKFLAGQYIEFIRPDNSRRAFSIASAPEVTETIELHIRLVPDGEFTGHVFEGMKEKDILRLEGPLGTFFLREDSDKPIILLAGGTGFAPIKSLVEHALHKGIRRPMHLYWGARDKAGLYLDGLAAQWAAEHAHIRYTPVLSDAPASDGWQGRTGLVHRAVLADHADLSGFEVYACGAPVMIEAAQQDFRAQGLADEAFFADSFTFAVK